MIRPAPRQKRRVRPISRPPRDHDIRVTTLNNAHRFNNRRQTRRPIQRRRITDRTGVQRNAHMTGRHIRKIFQHPKRHNLFHRRLAPCRKIVGAVGQDTGTNRVRYLGNFRADQIAAENHPEALRISRSVFDLLGIGHQPGASGCHRHGDESELNVSAHDLNVLLRLDVIFRPKIADLRSERTMGGFGRHPRKITDPTRSGG